RLAQGDTALDYVDDVDAVEQLIDEGFGDATGHGRAIRVARCGRFYGNRARRAAGRRGRRRAGRRAQAAPSRALTRSLTRPRSARPTSCGRSSAMTLP